MPTLTGSLGSGVRTTPQPTYAPPPTSTPYKPQKIEPEKRDLFSLGGIWDRAKSIASNVYNSKPVEFVSDVVSAPGRFISGGTQRTQQEEIEQVKNRELTPTTSNFVPSLLSRKPGEFASEFLKGGLSHVFTPRQYDYEPFEQGFSDTLKAKEEAGAPSSRREKVSAFSAELAFPSLFDIASPAKLLKGTTFIDDAGKLATKSTKLNELLQPVIRPLTQFGDDALKYARETPALYKPAELFSEYFRAPQVGNILKDAERAGDIRISKLAENIKEVVKTLSPVEQKRLGQIVEGGVSISQGEEKLRDAAIVLNQIADDIGAEAVNIWERTGGAFGLNPESYKNLKGRYLPHIWLELQDNGAINTAKDAVKGLSGKRFLGRVEDAKGYTMEAGPAAFVGLSQELRDIELVKGYLNIAEKYGVKAEQLTKPEDVIKGAINQLLKEGPLGKAQPKFLEDIKPGSIEEARLFDQRMGTDTIGNYLLDVFRKYQPAHRLSQAEEKAKKIYTGLAKAELSGKTPQALEEWVRRNGTAFQQIFGYTPDESKLRAIVGLVGDLPGPKQGKPFISTNDAFRMLKEDFGYAPEEIKKMKVSSLFKDVALPDEVIEYINKSQQIPAKNIYDKALNAWKFGKTMPNPAYHFRNLISNQILADMSTGKGLAYSAKEWVKTVLGFASGPNGKYVDAADAVGLIKTDSYAESLKDVLEQADLFERGKLERIKNVMTGLQNSTEEISKVVVFKSWVDDLAKSSKMTVDEVLQVPEAVKFAANKAEEAIFSPYNIGKAEKALMGRIIPFYSFTRQIVPFTAKTALENPQRLYKYQRVKNAVEGLSEDVVPQEDRPEYMQSSIQLPFKTDGLPTYLDPQYIYPFGSVSEAGAQGLPFGLNLTPLATTPIEVATNYDFYFDQPITTNALQGFDAGELFSTKPRRAGTEKAQHAMYQLAPAATRSLAGKIIPAFKGEVDYAGRTRNKWQSILDGVFGIKLQAVDPKETRKFDEYEINGQIRDLQNQLRNLRRDKRFKENYSREEQQKLQNEIKEAITELKRQKN